MTPPASSLSQHLTNTGNDLPAEAQVTAAGMNICVSICRKEEPERLLQRSFSTPKPTEPDL